jgi:uncharacterized protein (DUF488 family)
LKSLAKAPKLNILTIGYSTRTFEEFAQLLEIYGVTLLVDVRAVPRSKHNPQFNKERFANTLKLCGIKYIHMPEIGGLRRPKHNTNNLAWKNSGLRGYADYMQTREFTDNLLKIMAFAREYLLVLMCAEALPWRCHRNLISDALVARNVEVRHIISKDNVINHVLSETAYVEGKKITYPLFTKKTPQRTLDNFNFP